MFRNWSSLSPGLPRGLATQRVLVILWGSCILLSSCFQHDPWWDLHLLSKGDRPEGHLSQSIRRIPPALRPEELEYPCGGGASRTWWKPPQAPVRSSRPRGRAGWNARQACRVGQRRDSGRTSRPVAGRLCLWRPLTLLHLKNHLWPPDALQTRLGRRGGRSPCRFPPTHPAAWAASPLFQDERSWSYLCGTNENSRDYSYPELARERELDASPWVCQRPGKQAEDGSASQSWRGRFWVAPIGACWPGEAGSGLTRIRVS